MGENENDDVKELKNENSENLDNADELDNNDGDEVVITSTDGLKISNDAVATYAGIAISEVQGVYGMSGGFAGFTEAISGKKNFTKGIKVDVDDKNAKIDVSIIVEYGARIPDVAFEIQTMVKKSVETMTGLKVLEVNVHVNGVHMASKDDKDEKEDKEDSQEN